MHRSVALLLALLLVSGCYRTEAGLVLGLPDYEKRNAPVTTLDLRILIESKRLLANDEDWTKASQQECNDNSPYSLYCALASASRSVAQTFHHRQAALQEVRFVIDEEFRHRWIHHRLADFNTHTETTHDDIIGVLDESIGRVREKLVPE